MNLRRRILLTVAPALALLAGLGAAGLVLLTRVSYRIDAILRENYDSVRAMTKLNEALERIDSSFQFALAGREHDAATAFHDNWAVYREAFEFEQKNVTILPVEQELVDHLNELTRRYDEQGTRFFARPTGDKARTEDYFSATGLLANFRAIKGVATDIHRLNENNMQQASHEARRTARSALAVFGIGVGVAILLGVATAWRLQHVVVGPIEAVANAARAIGSGQLSRTVPVTGTDEVGQLATAFNAMTTRLREYRQTNTDRLLRARQTAQATIDSFPDAVAVVDPEGRVELANSVAIRVLGVAPRSDKSSTSWQPPESLRDSLEASLRRQQPALTERFDQAVPFRLDGEDHFFLPQVRPIRSPDGDTLGAAVVLTDVTRFRLLDRLKSDLVATVSHELKTPLTSVRLAIHVLLEETIGPLEPKQTELLLDARENTERLLAMIEHLLALAQLEHGRTPFEAKPVDPGVLLQAAADAAAARAEDRHIQIVVEIAETVPPVPVDAARFGHALDNLIDNALTYTEPGGRVTLSAAADGDRVRMAIADTGVGIPAESVPHVFDKFFRVPDPSRPPGTGLGLAIVREVIQACGGEITCESTPGKGTVFHIALPVAGGGS
ncbi:MAG: ATP-binding protein [Gemmataceae bacterium]